MSRVARLPGVLLWRIAAVLAAGAAGWWIYQSLDASQPSFDDRASELVGQFSDFPRTRSQEKGWVDRALPVQAVFDPELMLSPPTGSPCPRDLDRVNRKIERLTAAAQKRNTARALASAVSEAGDHWLPTLAYSNFLFLQGQPVDAERQLAQLTRTPDFKRLYKNTTSRGIEEELAEIHVLHALSYARMRNRTHENEDVLWDLRRAIRRADYLGKIGQTDRAHGDPNWYIHHLRRPGCTWNAGGLLSTFDLYNNLIQLYLIKPYQEDKQEVRDKELSRGYQDPPNRNPMQRVLQRAVETRLEGEEAWVWAASNVERLARNRREHELGPPDHSRLALTMARVMAEGDPLVAGQSAQAPLWREIAAYATSIGENGSGSRFAPALIRLELLGRIAGYPFESSAQMPEAQGLIRALAQAVEVRSDPALRTAVLQGKRAELESALQPVGGSEPWLQALRLDAASALAQAGIQEEATGEKATLIRIARSLIGEDSPPKALDELEASLGLKEQIAFQIQGSIARWTFAALVGLVGFLIVWWLGLQVLVHKHLFTSFYRLEAEAKLRGGR